MAIGPGKYDDLATYVREQSQAKGVVVIVFDGNKGGGFSAQFADPAMATRVPDVLRQVADQMDIGGES